MKKEIDDPVVLKIRELGDYIFWTQMLYPAIILGFILLMFIGHWFAQKQCKDMLRDYPKVYTEVDIDRYCP